MFPSNVCLVHQRSTWTPSLGCFFRGQLRLNFLFCFYFSFLSSSLKQYYLHVSLLEKGRWLKICMLFCTIWLKKVSFLNCVCFDLFSGCQQSTLFQIFFFFFNLLANLFCFRNWPQESMHSSEKTWPLSDVPLLMRQWPWHLAQSANILSVFTSFPGSTYITNPAKMTSYVSFAIVTNH